MRYVRLTKTDGAKQQEVYVRRDAVAWVQGAAPPAVPAPDQAEPSGSGAILHFTGAPGHTVTVTESIDTVVRLLEADD